MSDLPDRPSLRPQPHAGALLAGGLPGNNRPYPRRARRDDSPRLPTDRRPQPRTGRLTGHKTESVYRRYAIVSERDPAEGVAKLATLHHASRTQDRTIYPLRRGTLGAHQEPTEPKQAAQG
jgi:hypothetical protein